MVERMWLDTQLDRPIRHPGRPADLLVLRRSQVHDEPVRPRGIGEGRLDDGPPHAIEALEPDERGEQVQAVRRDPVTEPERTPARRNADDIALRPPSRRP